jgi:hypothetical protein
MNTVPMPAGLDAEIAGQYQVYIYHGCNNHILSEGGRMTVHPQGKHLTLRRALEELDQHVAIYANEHNFVKYDNGERAGYGVQMVERGEVGVPGNRNPYPETLMEISIAVVSRD